MAGEMKTLPGKSHMHWRRLDGAGCEEASIEQTGGGWRLTGQLEAEEARVHAELRYVIDCDSKWRTRRAVVTGTASGDNVRFEFTADGEGEWRLNGAPLPLGHGALDIDLGFTPATNLLPIRRLDLEIGERATVRTVWLRFPELRVDRLEQWYQREGARAFRYEAQLDAERFQARLRTDEFGRILLYENLWEAEAARRKKAK